MSRYTSGAEYERDLVRLHKLQQVVLLHLIGTGPTTWDALYVRFKRFKTDEIAYTLRYLARWNYITVEPDSTTRITPSGASQLQRRSTGWRKNAEPDV
jgi:hypothetical protein